MGEILYSLHVLSGCSRDLFHPLDLQATLQLLREGHKLDITICRVVVSPDGCRSIGTGLKVGIQIREVVFVLLVDDERCRAGEYAFSVCRADFNILAILVIRLDTNH